MKHHFKCTIGEHKYIRNNKITTITKMNWSSRKESTMVNAVTLLLCAVALGKVNTNIIEVYGQQLQQQQHQNNNSDSDSDIQRKLITFFSIKNHEDTDPTKKPTHAPTPHQAYKSDDYFNEGSYPTAKVSQMPTPYGQPTDRPTPRPTPEPTPHPTTKNTPAPSRRTPPGPIPYQQYYPPKPIASPSTLPTPRPTPVPTNLPTVSKIKPKTPCFINSLRFDFSMDEQSNKLLLSFLLKKSFLRFHFISLHALIVFQNAHPLNLTT